MIGLAARLADRRSVRLVRLLLDEAPRTASVFAKTEAEVVRIPSDAFEELLGDSRVVRRMFRTVTSRLRGIEETLRHEERMAALGRMAAQLMHELNNPAAAVGRTSKALRDVHQKLGEAAVERLAAIAPEKVDQLPPPEPTGPRFPGM